MPTSTGNGHELDFSGDPSVFIVDMYNSSIYPNDVQAKRAISVPVELKTGTGDELYMPLLNSALKNAFRRFLPDFILYNAGTDCLSGDPLGELDVSPEGIQQRDEIVFREALSRKIPILMVLSGGYQRNNAQVIAESILHLNTKFGILKVDRPPPPPPPQPSSSH
mmetsp:Transcript_8389/g.13664  ORF Transcript_8389/g.13664 Transcript_8389/m.13664 type:complete len:165 (+) Transcript_8389:616-1110(+)